MLSFFTIALCITLVAYLPYFKGRRRILYILAKVVTLPKNIQEIKLLIWATDKKNSIPYKRMYDCMTISYIKIAIRPIEI